MQPAPNLLPPKAANATAIALIAACGLYIFRWVFNPELTFFMDDWSWLAVGVFGSWSSLLSSWTFLPARLYADRPIAFYSVKLLYQIFHLNHTGYAAAILSIHIANAVLLYLLAARLLSSRFYGMIAAIFFVIDHSVAYPAWWLATIADSASLFFCLCAFLAFVSGRAYSALATVLFYYLAVKSKEAALPLPLLLFAHSFLGHLASVKLSALAKALRAAFRSAWPVLCAFILLFGFTIYHYVIAKQGGMEGYGPYVPHFDLPTFIDGAGIYLSYAAFDLISPNQALIGFLALSAVAVGTFDRVAIVGGMGFFCAVGPVIFLPNQRVPYYAYAGSAFLALMLVALVQRGDNALARRLGVASGLVAKGTALLAVLWFTHFVYPLDRNRETMFARMNETHRALVTLASAVSHVEEETSLVITGVPPGVTLFAHAPCTVVNVLFEVWKIDCRIKGTDADLSALYAQLPDPKILLRYDRGEVSLRARSP